MTFDEAHQIIKRGDVIALRHALDSGLDPNLLNRFGWSLLMLVALEGDLSIGELLLSRGANVNATNKFGDTALSLAAHNRHVPFFQMLLSKGASTDCRPHGAELEGWLRVASSAEPEKIDLMMSLIKGTAK
jgi:ankyrin repeat protein